MSKHDDGGAAWPETLYGPDLDGRFQAFGAEKGMTLLDWFAGQVAGPLAARRDVRMQWREDGATTLDLAQDAYSIAAVLIAEKRRREAEEPQP